MCKFCDEREGTNYFTPKKEVVAPVAEIVKEKDEAEKEVSPQTNATMTVLTPAPEAGITITPTF